MTDSLDPQVAAVIVWFNPEPACAKNLETLQTRVSHVIVIDNSDVNNSHILRSLNRATYIPLYKNTGVAAALNLGCRTAFNLGVEWVLTMDQDSWFRKDVLDLYLDPLAPHFSEADVATIGPSINPENS